MPAESPLYVARLSWCRCLIEGSPCMVQLLCSCGGSLQLQKRAPWRYRFNHLSRFDSGFEGWVSSSGHKSHRQLVTLPWSSSKCHCRSA